ncbi:unnamed protein product [Closterium sp. Naga37s-1]|nr:unnamed protein product [Closterium sp. Naga37s-1]
MGVESSAMRRRRGGGGRGGDDTGLRAGAVKEDDTTWKGGAVTLRVAAPGYTQLCLCRPWLRLVARDCASVRGCASSPAGACPSADAPCRPRVRVRPRMRLVPRGCASIRGCASSPAGARPSADAPLRSRVRVVRGCASSPAGARPSADAPRRPRVRVRLRMRLVARGCASVRGCASSPAGVRPSAEIAAVVASALVGGMRRGEGGEGRGEEAGCRTELVRGRHGRVREYEGGGGHQTSLYPSLLTAKRLSILLSSQPNVSLSFPPHPSQAYDDRLRQAFQDPSLPYHQHHHHQQQHHSSLFPPEDAAVLEAYLMCLHQVLRHSPPPLRTRLFSDAFFDALFRLLPHAAVPPALKGALRSAIAAFLGAPATVAALTTSTAPAARATTAAAGFSGAMAAGAAAGAAGGGATAGDLMAVAAAAAGLTGAAAAALAARTWALEEFYDLPPSASATLEEQQARSTPYDMGMELSEVEARVEEYPSTLSYLRLHNTLLALDPLSRPARFLDYFRFVTSSVFVPYTRRVYARADEMWQLLLASLSLFHLSLLLLHRSPLPSAPPLAALSAASSSSANGLLPAGATPGLLLMKDFLSAGPALRNIIAIITAGPDALLEERALRPQALSFALEDTVAACLRLLLLALSLDQSLADTWQPAVRPLHLVLADDVVLVTAVMSFVRYQPSDAIQRSAIELTSVFSARGVPLVAMALEVGMVQRLVEDFAECLDVSASTVSVQGVAAHGDAGGATVDGGGEEEEGGEEGEETDCATLILQLLLASLGRQRPTLAHMLLGFDVDRPLAASLLQPNRRFSALRILLDLVLSTGADADSDQSDATAPPRVTLRLARLREMSVRVLYHLAADPATSAPTAVLLQAKPLSFFAPLLSSALSAPLPRRSSSPGHRVAALHERAWLLKLLALALHTTPPAPHAHKHHHSHHAAHSATAGRQLEICRQILSALFMADGGVGGAEEVGEGGNGALVVWGGGEQQAEGVRGGVLGATQLLELFLFALPDVTPSFLPHIAAVHHQLQLEELLGTAAGVAEGGVFEVNERGDRLVDLRALSHILTHRFALLEAQRGPGAPFLPGPNLGVAGSAAGSAEVRQEAVREALRFVWRRNRVEEEAAAQQHVALAWAQLLQMALSRRFDLLPPHARLEALLQLLSACLRAIAAPHTPLTLAKPISQVVLVAFLQLQHLSSSSSPTSIDTPSSDDAGEVTWSDVIGHSSLSDTSSREGLGGGASGAGGGGAGGGGPRRQVSVAESTGLLRDLLGALMRKDSSDSLRRRLYTSLLTFLAICARRFRSADVDISPAVMAVILKELPGEETSSDRSLDMLERQRREMQRATHALLSPHLPTLIRTLSHDASSSPSPLTRSLALAALSSLLSHSADPIAASASLAPTNGIATAGRDHRSIFAQSVGGGQNQNLPIGFGRLPDLAPGMTSALAVASTSAAAVLSQMQAHGMVQACIADVSKGISEVLLLPSADAQRQAFVTEARLALLLAMAAATGRQGLLLLLNAGFLRAMAACPSLDAPVSEASYLAPPPVGLSSLDVPSESLCFAHLVAPVLRLLLALSTLAPPDASLSPHAPPSDATSKADVASQLVQFAIHHEPMLSRLLEDRSPACNPTDLLLLSLSTAFLSRALLWADPSQLEGLRGLMLRAAAAYSVGDGESRVKYVRQRVAREEDDRAGEIGGISLSLLLPPEEQAMEEGVLRVRANLMAYLRSLVAFKRLLLPAASKHQHQGPTLSLLSDLLRQMVIDLQAAVEARGTALTKLADVNDMSRHEAEELIHATAFHAPHSAAHSHLPLRQARRQALLILAGLASSKERALSWMLFICEHLLHLLLAHFSLHHSLLSRSSSPLASSLSPSPTTFSSRPRSLRVQGPRVSPSPGGPDGMGFGGVADGGEDAGAAAEAAAAGMGGGHSREEFESTVGTTADLEKVAREVLPSVNRLVEVNETESLGLLMRQHCSSVLSGCRPLSPTASHWLPPGFPNCQPSLSPRLPLPLQGHVGEALAAKDAAESLPEFGMVDSFIRWLSTYLGSSGPWHQRFLDLQEVFTQTNLELQGINDVRWLSRGDAVCRLLAVLPGVVVMVHELGNKPMYQMVTSYRFQFMLRFLADVLEQLNVLSKTFQHRQIDLLAIQGQIRRTTTHINSRYVDCGDDFGGGLSEKLSPFIARHGLNGVRRVEVEWVDSDGRPTSHCYVLHDSPLEGYPIAGTHERCVEQCTAMAEALVHNLDERLGSLDKLSGVKLFMPDEWPHGRQERSMPDWAEVVKIWRAYKKRKPITTVAAPKKQPSAKGKEKVDEDDAGGAGSGWGTETPVHRHGSMSDGGGSDEDEDMCVM